MLARCRVAANVVEPREGLDGHRTYDSVKNNRPLPRNCISGVLYRRDKRGRMTGHQDQGAHIMH